MEQQLPNLRFVQIQTQSRCNADCVFCPYVEGYHAKNPGLMPRELWLKILNDLLPFTATLNQGKILPYLMQEPLLDKDIFQKIEDIYERFPKTFVELSTNGAALTPKNIDRIHEVFEGRRAALWVSFHGVDAQSLEHIMALPFQRSLDNLMQLLKRADGRLRIIIRGAGRDHSGRETWFSRQDYLDFWNQQFKDHNINTDKIHVDAFSYHDRAGTLFRKDRDAWRNNLGKIREIGPGHQPFSCKRVTDWLHIDYEGYFRLCCMDYHKEVLLPNVKEMSISTYFQSNAYRDLVDHVTGKKESEANFICKRCISPGG